MVAEGGKQILFISPGHADRGFWKAVGDTMHAAAEAFGYELTIVSGDRKWPLMISRGLEAIHSQTPDYLVIVNEHQQAPVLMELAQERGIPTILLLNSLTAQQQAVMGGPRDQLSHWLGSLVPDNEIAGFEMARSLAETGGKLGLDAEGPMPLLTLAGDFSTPASIDRLAGLDRALEDMPSLQEMRRITVNWSEDVAYERTRLFLETGDVKAVWAANDPIATGAIKALTEAGKIPGIDFVVAGLNWSPKAVDLVRGGQMTLTHGGHFLAGAWVVILIHDLDQGYDFADLSTEIGFPMSAIDTGNADEFLDAFRDQDWSRIDFRKFSRAVNPDSNEYEFTLTKLLQSLHPK